GGVQVPHLDAESNMEPLGRADEGTLVLALKQYVSGVEVAQTDAPLARGPDGQHHARTVVEVETDSRGARLGRLASGWRIRPLVTGIGRHGGVAAGRSRLVADWPGAIHSIVTQSIHHEERAAHLP